MIVTRTVSALRETLRPLRPDGIGFVPTMGALHEGHLALLRRARSENDAVVLSIFVNPTQFDKADDLARYPRTVEDDLALADRAGADVVFLPSAEEMYPPGFGTTVRVDGSLAENLEGASRGSGHFDGVATVVAKLLLAVGPDTAYFGEKDAQQLVVVRRMVTDLGIPVRIASVPTSRDGDGLACSSRNMRLTAGERAQALAIPRALDAAQARAAAGERDATTILSAAQAELVAAGLVPEYLVLVEPDELQEVATVETSALLAIAVRVGSTRLIDNTTIRAEEPQGTSKRRNRS